MSEPRPMIDVTVLVTEDHQDQMAKVARALKAKGFILKETLEAIGTLTGRVPASAMKDLHEVAGVQAVEENRDDYRTQKP